MVNSKDYKTLSAFFDTIKYFLSCGFVDSDQISLAIFFHLVPIRKKSFIKVYDQNQLKGAINCEIISPKYCHIGKKNCYGGFKIVVIKRKNLNPNLFF